MPEGLRAYVIGDVHGRADLLTACRDRILADLAHRPAARALTVTLGDYVDRGPDSFGVLETLCGWPDEAPLIALRGNHEQMLLEFLDHPSTLDAWRKLGGLETLQSYGVELGAVIRGAGFEEARRMFAAQLPQAHHRFLDQTGLSLTLGDYFFCHAGVRPGVPLDAQSPRDLLWIRNEFLSSSESFGRVIVHGHTPAAAPEFLPNRVNLDTGAYATGVLTCLVLEGEQMLLLQE